LDSSWLSFTSTRIGSFFPSALAAASSRCAIFRESTASMAWNSSAARVVLLGLERADEVELGVLQCGEVRGFLLKLL